MSFFSKKNIKNLFFAILLLNTHFIASNECRSLTEKADVHTQEISTPVVIVGAGLSGLITAYELNKAGIQFLILEASDRIGGRVETIHYSDGTFAEAHMEEYWDETPNVTLLKELNIPTIKDSGYSSTIINDKILSHDQLEGRNYFKHIFNSEEYAAAMQWNDNTWKLYKQLKTSLDENKPLSNELKKLMHISFAEFIINQNLPEKVIAWIRKTLEPEISVSWKEICALDGIDEISLFLMRPNGKYLLNHHVEGGNDNYIDALVKSLPEKSILTNARVKVISQADDRVEVIYNDAMGNKNTISALYAVVTVPLFSIDAIEFIPPLSNDYQKAIKTTKFASYIKIQYRVKPTIEEVWAKYKTDNLFTLLTDQPIGCIYNFTDLQKNLSKEQDWLISVLVHGEQAREWCKLPCEQIKNKANAEMDKIFPNFSDYITSMQVYPYPQAIAYWPVGSRSRFDELAVNLRKPLGRIQIGGDTTEESHSAGAAKAGKRMATQIIKSIK